MIGNIVCEIYASINPLYNSKNHIKCITLYLVKYKKLKYFISQELSIKGCFICLTAYLSANLTPEINLAPK